MKHRRRNPFLAKPPDTTYMGRKMSGVETHPGFHTSENRDIVMPYAQAKAEHSEYFVDDYPVILGFNMKGLDYFADYDAEKVFERIRDAYSMHHGFDSFDEFMDATLNLGEDVEHSQYPLQHLRAGTNGTDILFSRDSAYHNPEEKFARYVLDMDDDVEQENMFDALVDRRFSSKMLANILEQRRYIQDIPDDRLIVVYYMQPVWNLMGWPWGDESSQATEFFIQSLEDNGWTVYTTSEIEETPWELRAPKIKVAWRGENKRYWSLQYHGTSYQNLIKAVPWLKDKLPKPPSPFGRSIDFEEDALEFTRSVMPGFRVEYTDGYIEAVEPDDVEEE